MHFPFLAKASFVTRSTIVSHPVLLVACLLAGLHAPAADAALPSILVSPRSTTVHVGDTATFTVYADGAEMYRWYVNSVEVPSGTAKLVLPSVKLTDDRARITCIVGNSSGVRSSDEAILKVIRPTREMLTFTGDLADLAGHPVGGAEETSIDMVVDLYSSVSGGELLYREVFVASEGRGVPVVDGRFLARLGSGRIVSGTLTEAVQSGPNVHAQFHLGTVGSLESLEPRVPLTSMPYAFSSASSRLKGKGVPATIGLEAPVGSTYNDLNTGKIWLRSFATWVEVP